MVRAVLLLVLGLATALLAHEHSEDRSYSEDDPTSSVYTGPMFNPTEALHYGQTDIPSTTSAAHSTASTSHSPVSVTAPASSAPTSDSLSTSPATTGSGATSTTPTVAQVSGTGAAQVNYPEYIGAVAGGLLAGFALV